MRDVMSREKRSAIHIKKLRKGRNMSQEQFAGEIGVATNTISRIETGTVPLSAEVALKIKEKFTVSMDYLFGFSDYEEGEPPCDKTCEELNEAQIHIDLQDNIIRDLSNKLRAITEILADKKPLKLHKPGRSI